MNTLPEYNNWFWERCRHRYGRAVFLDHQTSTGFINQSTIQSTDWYINHSINQASLYQSLERAINQIINQSINNQSVHQSISHTTINQSIDKSTKQSINQAINQSNKQPINWITRNKSSVCWRQRLQLACISADNHVFVIFHVFWTHVVMLSQGWSSGNRFYKQEDHSNIGHKPLGFHCCWSITTIGMTTTPN
jgi:hypothetical protein